MRCSGPPAGTARIRSYSMNAMIGNAGNLSTNGYNINNPSYTQFFKIDTNPRAVRDFCVPGRASGQHKRRLFSRTRMAQGASGYGNSMAPRGMDTICPLPTTTVPPLFPLPMVMPLAPLVEIQTPFARPRQMPPIFPSRFPPRRPMQGTDFDWVMDHMSIEKLTPAKMVTRNYESEILSGASARRLRCRADTICRPASRRP